jgi:RNA polymerase sigma-70 factor (ECF subfamily)
MDRLRDHDGEAARQVFNRFAGRLIGLARGRLDRALLAKVGPEDVVQSAFRSFFRGQADGRFDARDWDELWSLLVVLTARKCGRQLRRFRTEARDVRKEVAAPDDSAPLQALAREPSPEEAAMLAETLEQLLSSLRDRERQVLELRLLGFTVPEISLRVGRSEYTVEGILKRLRLRLKPLCED